MFVKTIKFDKKIAVATLAAVAVLLAAIVLFTGIKSRSGERSNFSINRAIKTNEDRLEYLANLGWECDPKPIDEQIIVIPRQFTQVFEDYNTLQKQQGFDLSQFGGLEVTIYRYKVLNYPTAEENVVAQILVLNYEVVGGDVHSTAIDGFIHGLK